MSAWYPREEDLTERCGRALEEAYRQRERQRCSRDDFADGWLAALRWLGSRSSFQPNRFEPQEEG